MHISQTSRTKIHFNFLHNYAQNTILWKTDMTLISIISPGHI